MAEHQGSYEDRDGWIWFDGELVPWRDAKVHVLTHALHYACSVFEGQRAYNGEIFKLREHSRAVAQEREPPRVPDSVDVDEIDAACNAVVKANGFTDAYMRPVAWRGAESMGVSPGLTRPHLAIAAWEWGKYYDAAIFRERHHAGHFAVAAARALHRADRVQGGRPVHDLHAGQAAGGGARLQRCFDVRLARAGRRSDRGQRLLRRRQHAAHAGSRLLPRRDHAADDHRPRAPPRDRGRRTRDLARGDGGFRADVPHWDRGRSDARALGRTVELRGRRPHPPVVEGLRGPRLRAHSERLVIPRQAGWIGDIADASRRHVSQQILEPRAVEPPLPVKVVDQMFAPCRKFRGEFLADGLQLGDQLVQPRDPAAQGAFDDGKVGEMQE